MSIFLQKQSSNLNLIIHVFCFHFVNVCPYIFVDLHMANRPLFFGQLFFRLLVLYCSVNINLVQNGPDEFVSLHWNSAWTHLCMFDLWLKLLILLLPFLMSYIWIHCLQIQLCGKPFRPFFLGQDHKRWLFKIKKITRITLNILDLDRFFSLFFLSLKNSQKGWSVGEYLALKLAVSKTNLSSIPKRSESEKKINSNIYSFFVC